MLHEADPPRPPRPSRASRALRRTAADRLRAALRALAGERGQVRRHTEKAWASITFEGARHTLEIDFDGAQAVAAAEHFIADLPEHEFAIPGQIVAEATVTRVDHTLLPHPRLTLECELLLLEDA
ncbi:hypothetical protein [Pelagerythrobacter marensis]|uniref:Uncharacterized protein n=1 Tax=Pelagerythrobacter marensis TaxID=543877 RepID=A0A0G3X7Q0_9SPHN|nr:hypothetical protein [Pelagerythrobacter marensis]AKM07555.1 hypothetical protein AM2010_1485 [Pelagerythrobacter marensis]